MLAAPGFEFTACLAQGGIAAKRVTRARTYPYPNVRLWRFKPAHALSIDEMAGRLRELAPLHAYMIIRGAPREGLDLSRPQLRRLHDQPDGAATIASPTLAWVALDLDDVPVPAPLGDADMLAEAGAYVRDNELPPEFRDVRMIATATANTGRRGSQVARLRLFVLLDRRVSGEDLHHWAKGVVEETGLPIDPAVMRAHQPIYTARPRFEDDIEDPVPEDRRVVIIEGSRERAAIDIERFAPVARRIEHHVDEAVRRAAGDWRALMDETVGGGGFYEPLTRALGLAARSGDDEETVSAYVAGLLAERADAGRQQRYDRRWVCESLRRFRENDAARAAEKADGEYKRPTVRLEVGRTQQIVEAVEDALIAADLGLYRRAGLVVSVGYETMPTHDEQTVEVQVIRERGDAALRVDMETAAVFERFDGRSEAYKVVPAPSKLVAELKQQTPLRFPPLNGVINHPLMKWSGAMLTEPGYDAGLGLLFDPRGHAFPPIPDRPTREQAAGALDRLARLLRTFDFKTDEDRAVALSLLLTAMERRVLDHAPLHAIDAPVRGAGKGMIVNLASMLATGGKQGVMNQGRTSEEFEKRLGTLMMRGDAVIAIDNCEQPIEGDALCSALTESQVSIRILGRSEMPTVPTNMLFTATGNNLTVRGDMTRRVLIARLDPRVEHPERRQFDYDPVADAKANRGELVAAALTIVRAYHVAGRPGRPPPLGSFGKWSELIRGALMWLGVADPVGTMERAQAADPVVEELRAVMEQWLEVIGPRAVTAAHVIKVADERNYVNTPGVWGDYEHTEFRDALMMVAGRGNQIIARLLGNWIARHADRVISLSSDASYRFTRGGERRAGAEWRLVKV